MANTVYIPEWFTGWPLWCPPHFGWPKITFDRISRHFRSIRNFYFFDLFFTKWLPATILDDRKSILIFFHAISDQYATLIFLFTKWLPFWMTENRFRSHFSPFQINTQLWFFLFNFHKMAAGGHFGWTKITFECISRHFRSIHNFFFGIFFWKWPLAAILEVRFWPILDYRKSLSIAFLAISDQYTTFFWKVRLRQKQ